MFILFTVYNGLMLCKNGMCPLLFPKLILTYIGDVVNNIYNPHQTKVCVQYEFSF